MVADLCRSDLNGHLSPWRGHILTSLTPKCKERGVGEEYPGVKTSVGDE